MTLVQRLRLLAEAFENTGPLLQEAATRIEDQRLWRDMWLDAEKRVEELTSELNEVRSQLSNRK
jgi:hypothetical protein